MNVLIVNNVDLFNINVIIILLFILSITIHIIRVKKLSVKLIHIIWNSSCFNSDLMKRISDSQWLVKVRMLGLILFYLLIVFFENY